MIIKILKDNKKCLDFIMVSTIFVVALIELWSWILSNISDHNKYLLFWFPFLSSLVILIFSLYFVIRIIRYNACIYTQIVVVLYALIQSFNVSAYFLKFGIEFYNKTIYPIFLFSIISLTLIRISKWLSKWPQQQ